MSGATEAKGAGFTGLALAVAVAAGIGSFAGWALGTWLGIPAGNLLWVVSSFVMCGWTGWFGVNLALSKFAA